MTVSNEALRKALAYALGGGAATAALAPSDSEAANIGPRGFRNLFGSELTEATPGAFRGADNMLRYEIPDNEMRLKPDFRREWMLSDSSWPHNDWLDNAISHPQLFKAYPELRDFDLSAALTPSGTRGAAYSDGLMAEAPNLKKLMDVIAHENQHGIQAIEGFQTGTTPELAGGYRQYLDTPGEREARMVEARRRLTEEQRAAYPQGGMWGAMGLGGGYGEKMGAGLRDVLTGLTSIPDMAINPFLNAANYLGGGRGDYFKSSGGALADILGLPKGDEGSLSSMVTQSVAGGLPMVPAGMAMQAGKRLPDLARAFSQYKLPDLGIDIGIGGLGYAAGGGR